MRDLKEISRFLFKIPRMIGELNMPIEETDVLQDIRHIIHEWKEYKDLEQQGKMPKLPCAVGDTVYTNKSLDFWHLRKEDRPYEAKVDFIGITRERNDNFINVVLTAGQMSQFKFSDIGKTVFFTEEEAEAALDKMKNEQ